DPPQRCRQPVDERADGDDEPQPLEQDLGIGQAEEQGDREPRAAEIDQAREQDRVKVRETRQAMVPDGTRDGHPSTPQLVEVEYRQGGLRVTIIPHPVTREPRGWW